MDTVTEPAADPLAKDVRLGMWALVASLLAHLPYVYVQLLNTLSRPHYQFVILVPIVVIADVRRSWPDSLKPFERALGGRTFWLLAVQLLLDGAAITFRSPWLGTIAFLWMLLVAASVWGGSSLLRSVLPAWICLWLFLPLPFRLDELLITSLRDAATRWAGSVLDTLGVMHVVEVNLIVLPERVLYVADACSGIHSLFVLLGSALMLSVWMRRTIVASLLLIGSSLFLVMVENVARLVVVAFASSKGWNLAEGWPHETLGFVLFGMSLLLLFSFDRLIVFLLPDGMPSFSKSRKSGKSRNRGTSTGGASNSNSGRMLAPAMAMKVLSGFALVVLGLQVARLPSAIPSLERVLPTSFTLPEFGEEFLPAEYQGLERSDYTVIERVQDDPMGAISQRWTFRNERMSVLISIDYPFSGPHDLTVCYQQMGWNLEDAAVETLPSVDSQPTESEPAGADGEFVHALMKRAYFGESRLLFSSADFEGRTGARLRTLEKPEVSGAIGGKFGAVIRQFDAPTDEMVQTAPSWFQIQLQATAVEGFEPGDDELLRQMFVEFRGLLTERCRAEGPQ